MTLVVSDCSIVSCCIEDVASKSMPDEDNSTLETPAAALPENLFKLFKISMLVLVKKSVISDSDAADNHNWYVKCLLLSWNSEEATSTYHHSVWQMTVLEF